MNYQQWIILYHTFICHKACFFLVWLVSGIHDFYTPVVLWNRPVCPSVRPSTIACERDILKTACRIDFTF